MPHPKKQLLTVTVSLITHDDLGRLLRGFRYLSKYVNEVVEGSSDVFRIHASNPIYFRQSDIKT